MKQFEYRKECFVNEDKLNRLGKEGWELVAVSVDQSHNEWMFFKREILATPIRKTLMHA